jgi:hypothetical protein
MRSWFFPIALSLPALAAAAPPQRVEIAYEVARNGSAIAEVAERLEHDGRSYRLQETWKGRGLYAFMGEVQRSSRGAVAADGLRPVEFEDRRSGREPRRVAFDARAGGPTLERQDRLSLLWSFAFAPPASAATVKVADGKGVATRVYQPAGRERVRVPAGEFDALKLVKRKDGPEDRGAEIWLAASRHYLPVRILITEKDGTRIEQAAVRIAAP